MLTLLCLPLMASAEEVTLFDSQGEPRAFINMADADKTIYLWDGTPVAYLKTTGSNTSVYGFNGKHLGWYAKGILRDHDGYIVGFKKGAVSKMTYAESGKGFKKSKPSKRYADNPPVKYGDKQSYSSKKLADFLKAGKN